MVLGDIPYQVRWWSTYRFHQRVVERFSVGRVFFAGDAAHALPPYGARGMNSGIQDADNLAWKLALVLDGLANEDLLNSYHAERRPAAEENLAVTEKTIRFMVPPSASRQLVRKVILWMANRTRLAKSRVNSGRMAEPFVYRSSPIIDRRLDQNLTGRLAPDGWLRSSGGQKIRLRRYLGRCFTIIAFIENVSEYDQLVALSDAIAPLPITILAVALTDSVELSAPDGLSLLKATEPLCAEFYVVGPCWMLVRPDGHVAAAFPASPDESAVRAALSRCGRLLGATTSSLKSCS
jgi:3-(3-hydroxy-phenyl)propionate hydroxylase